MIQLRRHGTMIRAPVLALIASLNVSPVESVTVKIDRTAPRAVVTGMASGGSRPPTAGGDHPVPVPGAAGDTPNHQPAPAGRRTRRNSSKE